MTILLTGGTGYIGSHTAVELLSKGYDVVIVDDLSNSDEVVIERIESITGVRPEFYNADVCDKNAISDLFDQYNFDLVMHFAGYKVVGESIEKAVEYYRNNIDSTLTLLEVMKEHKCSNIVFSSSASVYGNDCDVPVKESMPMGTPINPYAWTKWMIERILNDAAAADPALSVVALRYFNPVAAHKSALIGETPNGVPTNLMPYIAGAASGRYGELTIYGDDYDTEDGTCIRDFIHVVDLAKGHIAAIDYALNNKGYEVFNLGTGKGHSVKEMIDTFERVNGIAVPHSVGPRRDGDIVVSYADVSKSNELLNWKAELTIEDMCKDTWKWEQRREK